jgi:hypothetical protein
MPTEGDPDMSDLVPTSQAAAMLKAALRAAFPDVRFSVRKDTGTATGWLRVTYTGGPTGSVVQEIADRYTGQRFNAMTDTYDQVPDRLVQFDGEALPRPVQYLVDGVIVTRQMGPAGRAGVAAVAPDVTGTDADGNLTTEALTPERAVALGGSHYAYGPVTVRDVAPSVFTRLDVTRR